MYLTDKQITAHCCFIMYLEKRDLYLQPVTNLCWTEVDITYSTCYIQAAMALRALPA